MKITRGSITGIGFALLYTLTPVIGVVVIRLHGYEIASERLWIIPAFSLIGCVFGWLIERLEGKK